jgi:hypothetical protein
LHSARAAGRKGRRLRTALARFAAVWWRAVMTHVAEANGLPRPRS